MPLFNSLKEFYYDYEEPLARCLFDVESRGIRVDVDKLSTLSNKEKSGYVDKEIEAHRLNIENLSGRKVVIYKDEQTKNKELVINSDRMVSDFLINQLGLELKKVKRKNKDGSIKYGESVNKQSLEQLYAETGNEILRSILELSKLTKIKGTYIDATLRDNVLYASFITAGTKSGRRSSRTNFLDLGTNLQNLPKHSYIGKLYRQCLVSRRNKIFVSCDQRGAEDWVVQAIIADNGGSDTGLNELRAGVNRHRKLASYIFGVPDSQCSKDTPYYFLGKKTRHAGNYGERGATMSASLAAEGVHIAKQLCDHYLEKFHEFEPGIQNVFQAYVEQELNVNHRLTTPIGRSRIFFDLRDYSNNSAVYRDGYSYIPQSTVGDNTGLSILYIENTEPIVILDGHDAVVSEVADDMVSVVRSINLMEKSFDRVLRFPNGTEINIPVEFEMGYNLGSFDPDKNPLGMRTFDTLEQGQVMYEEMSKLRG